MIDYDMIDYDDFFIRDSSLSKTNFSLMMTYNYINITQFSKTYMYRPLKIFPK